MNESIYSAFEIARQTAISLYEGTPTRLLLLCVALLVCAAGCRLIRWVSALVGIVAGVYLGICLVGVIRSASTEQNMLAASVIAMLVLGVVGGIVAYRMPHVGIFVSCGFLGALVGYVPGAFIAAATQSGQTGLLLVMVVCLSLFGFTGVLFCEAAYLIVTALAGFPAGVVLSSLLGISSLPVTLLLGVGLTVIGGAVQLFLMRRAEIARAQAEEELQQTDPHLPILSEPEGEPDAIDHISDTVARRIELASAAPMVNLTPSEMDDAHENAPSDEPERADEDASTEPESGAETDEAENAAPEEPELAEDRTIILPKPQDALENTAEDAAEPTDTVLSEQRPEESAVVSEPIEEPEEAGEPELTAEPIEEAEETGESEPAVQTPDVEPEELARAVTLALETIEEAEQTEVAPDELARAITLELETIDEAEEPVSGPEDAPEENAEEPVTGPEDAPEENAEEPVSGPEDTPEENAEEPVAGPEDAPEENAEEPNAGPENAPEENAEEPNAGPENDALTAQEPIVLNEIKRIEPPESDPARTEPESEADENPPREKKPFSLTTLGMTVLMASAALLFALGNVQHMEILFALCFAAYMLSYYRLTAFVFAVLAVRRMADATLLAMNGGGMSDCVLYALTCLLFLALTLMTLRTAANSREE